MSMIFESAPHRSMIASTSIQRPRPRLSQPSLDRDPRRLRKYDATGRSQRDEQVADRNLRIETYVPAGRNCSTSSSRQDDRQVVVVVAIAVGNFARLRRRANCCRSARFSSARWGRDFRAEPTERNRASRVDHMSGAASSRRKSPSSRAIEIWQSTGAALGRTDGADQRHSSGLQSRHLPGSK